MSAISPPWPPPILAGTTFGLESNTGAFSSPTTNATQPWHRSGDRYKASVQLATLNPDTARLWDAFIAQAQEGARFYWNKYPLNSLPLTIPDVSGIITCDSDTVTCDSDTITCDNGVAWGIPVVNGSSQTGNSLVLDGFAPGTVLSAGDFLAFENGSYRELHQLISDSTADGSGNMTVTFRPPIRISPSDNTEILLDGSTTDASKRCAGEFMLASFYNPQSLGEASVNLKFDCYEPLLTP